MSTVLVLHDLPIERILQSRCSDLNVVTPGRTVPTIETVRSVDVVVVNSSGWDDRYLAGLNAGDWVHVTSSGLDSYPIDELRDKGVTVSNSAGVASPTVAEHAFALAVAFSRKIPEFADRMDDNLWIPKSEDSLELFDWKGRTLTIFGLGNIGESVAEKGLAFEMDVYGVKRDPARYRGCLPADNVLNADEFYDVVPRTDLLVISVPLTPYTEGVIGQSVFDALPDNAYIINVGRGPVVDEEALLVALEEGDIAGAGLDVVEDEPLSHRSPLWDRDDVLLSSHVGARAKAFPERIAELVVENYDRWRDGKQLINEIV